MSAALPTNAEPAPAELAHTGPAPRSEPSGADLPRDPCPGPSTSSPDSGSLGHDPKQAPTLARLERLVGHPVDPAKVRAAIGTFEAAPVQELPPTPHAGLRATRTPRRDASRTRSEARLAFRTPPVGGEDGLDDRRFSVLDVTSGLPDDSRDEDQRARALIERQRQGRVRAAQEALKAHPEAREVVMRDQTRLRMFCARFGITPRDLCPHAESDGARIVHPGSPRDGMCGWCHGPHGWQPIHVDDPVEVLATPFDWMAEVRAREAAYLPVSEGWA